MASRSVGASLCERVVRERLKITARAPLSLTISWPPVVGRTLRGVASWITQASGVGASGRDVMGFEPDSGVSVACRPEEPSRRNTPDRAAGPTASVSISSRDSEEVTASRWADGIRFLPVALLRTPDPTSELSSLALGLVGDAPVVSRGWSVLME